MFYMFECTYLVRNNYSEKKKRLKFDRIKCNIEYIIVLYYQL